MSVPLKRKSGQQTLRRISHKKKLLESHDAVNQQVKNIKKNMNKSKDMSLK